MSKRTKNYGMPGMTAKFMTLVAVLIAGAVGVVWWASGVTDLTAPVVSPAMHGEADAAPPSPADQVVVPELSPVALQGRQVFEENCSACHGTNAAGTDQGPPLIHNLYRPGHHSDAAFGMAVANGVVAHHWRFGNMPPIPGGISEAKMRWVVKYIREMQVANGVR